MSYKMALEILERQKREREAREARDWRTRCVCCGASFDTDPGDFYLTSYQDREIASEVDSRLRSLDSGPAHEQLTRVLAADGWVITPIAVGGIQAMQSAGADVAGRGHAKSLMRDNRVFSTTGIVQ